MFSRAFQTGSHLEIFDAKGAKEKGDDKLFKINYPQSVVKSYDKHLKSYVFDIAGSGKTRLTFPKDDRQELSLTQHFLVFQIFIPTEALFCLEVMITDTLKNKRRLIFTNNLREIEKTHFHIKIPLENVKKGVWLNLSFDLLSYFELFQGSIFRTIDGFNISGDFRLKRIFTMKNPLSEFDSDHEPNLPYISTQVVSKAINFSAGVDYSNQLITNLSMRRASPQSPSRFSESTKLKSSVSTPLLMTVVTSQQKSPDNAKKRNISEQLEDIKKPKQPENKENSSIISAQSRDTRKSYLLSTAESKRELLISPKFGDKSRARRFLSPKQDKSSLLKIHEIISKGRASEELTTPKKFKISQASKLHNISLEEKKEVPVGVGRSQSQSKASLESSKSSLLNRRVNSKRSQDPYLLVETASNPKFEVPTSQKNIAHSVRTKSTKNPWGETESTPGAKTALLKPNNSQKAAFISKTPSKYKAKEIKTRTAVQTPKDPLCESDRFSSTFNKSDYEQGWVIPGKDEGYDDDIESIEENLEYELNSNNSVTYGTSPNVREDRIRQRSTLIETSGREKKFNNQESHIDIYKAFMKRNPNDGEEGSRNIYGSYSKEVTKNDGKTTKRIIKQVEDKVHDLVSNARPYSPPFSSNILISNRPTVYSEEKKEDLNEKKLVEVEYDPVWDCYYNSKTDEYYQLKG